MHTTGQTEQAMDDVRGAGFVRNSRNISCETVFVHPGVVYEKE